MTRAEFAVYWGLEPRSTPLSIAMTTARVESSFNERAVGREVSGQSYGLFQFYSKYYPDAGSWDTMKQMREYDKRMGAELKKRSVRDSFRKWNGAGPAAEAYADKCMAVMESEFKTEVHDVPLPPQQVAGRSISVLTIAGVVVGAFFLLKKR